MPILTISKLIWLWLTVLLFGFTLGASKYFFFDYDLLGTRAAIYERSYGLINIHVITGVIWVALSLIQFLNTGKKRTSIHKLTGYLCFISGITSCLAIISMTIILDADESFHSCFGPRFTRHLS
jgi:hypothetical protein